VVVDSRPYVLNISVDCAYAQSTEISAVWRVTVSDFFACEKSFAIFSGSELKPL
jgi:hypothetical protein